MTDLQKYEKWLDSLVSSYKETILRLEFLDCQMAFCREQINKLQTPKVKKNEKSNS